MGLYVTGADMRNLAILSVCLATLSQAQGLCPVSKTVGGICYTRLNNSVETSQYGCQEPCLYTTSEGRTFCFKTGDQAVTENCSSLRHSWTCEHCRRTGRDLAGILTTGDGLAEIGGMLVISLCPLAPDRQECETSLPGFWGAIARIIFPQLGSSMSVIWRHVRRGRRRCFPPTVMSVLTGLTLLLTSLLGRTS